jgi:hypothetical protein
MKQAISLKEKYEKEKKNRAVSSTATIAPQ